MTQIDFYILASARSADAYAYVARLSQKVRNAGHTILIAVNHAEEAAAVSQALWSSLPESFLAHTPIDDLNVGIQITDYDQCGEHHDVLINLRDQAPIFFSRFKRVLEVVSQNEKRLVASRQRYRHYVDNGYPLRRHHLPAAGSRDSAQMAANS